MAGIRAEVCVVGGGPAGSGFALRMAQLGHTVALVERERFPRPRIGESLVPAILPLFDALGIRRMVEDAAFLRPCGTILRWAGATAYRASHPEAGLQVDRGRFDAIVLDAATAAGVRVVQPARAMPPSRHGDEWCTAVYVDGGITTVASRLVVDASGRSGWLPRRRRLSSPRTLALYAYWRDVPLGGQETRVEAGDAHWYWGAPLPGGLLNVAVFVDGSNAARIRAAGADSFYEHVVGRSSLLASCRRGRRASGVRICDATPMHDEIPATMDAVRIGEAAFAIDPLSSQGVQSALGSALHAAASVHTMLERPADAALALDFYHRAQRDAVDFHARAAVHAYREALERWPGPFWHRRAGSGPQAVSPEPRRTTAGQRITPDITTTVQMADGVRAVPAPVLSHDFVVRGTRIVVPEMDHEIAFIGDVELGPLLAVAQQPVSIERMLDAWGAHLERDRAIVMLNWLWAHGVLRVTDPRG